MEPKGSIRVGSIRTFFTEIKLPEEDVEHEASNKDEQIHYLLHEVKQEKPYFEPLILRHHLESVVVFRTQEHGEKVTTKPGRLEFLAYGG